MAKKKPAPKKPVARKPVRKPVKKVAKKKKVSPLVDVNIPLAPQMNEKKSHLGEVPQEATEYTTYAEHAQLMHSFFKGNRKSNGMGLLIIVGRPGISKTHHTQAYMDDDVYFISGKNTPYMIYQQLYWNRNKTIILNDAEVLWADKTGRIIVRALTETEPVKKLTWQSASKSLAEKGIPLSFKTQSRVLIIANKFKFGSDDETEAILDRGHVMFFNPSTLEVHKYASTWFHDQEIFDFFGKHLNLLERHSCRRYVKAWEAKTSGWNWERTVVEQYCYRGVEKIFREIYMDDKYVLLKHKEAAFAKQTGMCRKTFYNYLGKLKSGIDTMVAEVPAIKCKGKAPKKLELDLEEEDAAYEEGLEDE